MGRGRKRARHEGDHRSGRRGSAPRRRRRGAHDASRARRADALEAFAGPRFAALDGADAKRHPGRDIRDRRCGRRERRALRGRAARALRRSACGEARRIPPQADGRRPQERSAQAVNEEIRRAAEILRAGGLVAFPTETVYGLGADASSAAAIALLYTVKRRPMEHPVIVHFAAAERAFEWTREGGDAARTLAAKFWPGPLTLVLRRSKLAQDFVTRGVDTIGIRVPSHPVAHAMLDAFGGGVAGPSANRFGRISPTTAAH